MANKENKGGILTNEQVEQDLKAKGHDRQPNDAYNGTQDTGDKTPRHLGTDVQRADGRPAGEENGER